MIKIEVMFTLEQTTKTPMGNIGTVLIFL